jgi:hypothetical protein
MLPSIATVQAQPPVQTTLVATQIPDTNTLRAPYDSIAPSVSSAQIRDNARGNGGAVVLALAEAPQAAAASSASIPFIVPAFYSTSPGLSAGAQTNFLAQLLAQQPGGQGTLAGMMVEYEKLVVFSQVKYKPSNATLPPPQPAGLFGKMMQLEKAAPAQPPAAQMMADAPDAAPVLVRATVPARASSQAPDTDAPSQDEVFTQAEAPSAPAVVIGAYLASVQRNETIAPKLTENSA